MHRLSGTSTIFNLGIKMVLSKNKKLMNEEKKLFFAVADAYLTFKLALVW